jgi:hypothetical protein
MKAAIETLQNANTDQKLVEKIDNEITQISIEAEKRLPKYTNNRWHSQIPVLKNSLKQINTEIRKSLKKLKQDSPTIRELLEKKKKITKQFQQETKQGSQIRHTEMESKINLMSADPTVNKEKIHHLKQLLQVEKTRLLYAKIKAQITYRRDESIHLQVQHLDGAIKEVTNPQEIANHVKQYNMQHFAQAKETSFALYDGTCEFSQSITLEGHNTEINQIVEIFNKAIH